MTEQLPITISINSELVDRFVKINSVGNKLEAQFNFHALTANWYGDEENVLQISLQLEVEETFSTLKAEQKKLDGETLNVTTFSDDVFNSFNATELQLACYIAITESEVELLESQPKLLAVFLQKKLQKVLNLIAKQQSLTQI